MLYSIGQYKGLGTRDNPLVFSVLGKWINPNTKHKDKIEMFYHNLKNVDELSYKSLKTALKKALSTVDAKVGNAVIVYERLRNDNGTFNIYNLRGEVIGHLTGFSVGTPDYDNMFSKWLTLKYGI